MLRILIVSGTWDYQFYLFIFFVLAMKELDLLDEEANVYKLIGPVLVKQDLAEARANVKKRIDYISAELYAFPFVWLLLVSNMFDHELRF